MNENNRTRDNHEKIEGYWYVPGSGEPEHNEEGNILTDKIKLKGNRVKISNGDGKVDDYLASLISELFYVQAGTKIFEDSERDKDFCGLDEQLKELDDADKIHDDVIFLKKLFYKGIYSLEQVSRYEDGQLLAVFSTRLDREISEIISFYGYFCDEFYWLKRRMRNRHYPDWLLNVALPGFFLERGFSWFIGDEEYRSVEREQIVWLRYICRIIHAVYDLMYVNSREINKDNTVESDDLGKNISGESIKKLRLDITCLINIWTAVFSVFCFELDADWSNISRKIIRIDKIVIENINAVDLALGEVQINCIMAFTDSSKLHGDRLASAKDDLRILRLILSKCDTFFEYNFFGKKAKRCYGQMVIEDNKSTQYFSLSGSMKVEEKEARSRYYELAEKLLNENSYIMKQYNVKYVAVHSSESMRFYYGYDPREYLEYSQVVKIKEVEEAQKKNGSFLSRSFSCCERKLLQVVDEPGKEIKTKSIHIYVKYSPCEICKRALRAHKTLGFRIEVNSLRKYYKKRIETVEKLEDILMRSKASKELPSSK